jgi:hypothetical protein
MVCRRFPYGIYYRIKGDTFRCAQSSMIDAGPLEQMHE